MVLCERPPGMRGDEWKHPIITISDSVASLFSINAPWFFCSHTCERVFPQGSLTAAGGEQRSPQGCGCLSSGDEPRRQQFQQQMLTCCGLGAGAAGWSLGLAPCRVLSCASLDTSLEAHLCREPCWGLGRFRGSSFWGASWVCDVQLRPGSGIGEHGVWVSPGLGPPHPGRQANSTRCVWYRNLKENRV